MPKATAAVQENRRYTARPTQPAAQSRQPAHEPLVDGPLAADLVRFPGQQEQHRQEQQQHHDQEQQGHPDQDEVQIVDPSQEVRNW